MVRCRVERKEEIKDNNSTYFYLSHRKEFPLTEMEKEQLQGSIGHPIRYVKYVVVYMSLELKQEAQERVTHLSIIII